MTMSPTDPQMRDERALRQRRAVRRTAWTVAAIAVVIYAAFIASGVSGARGL